MSISRKRKFLPSNNSYGNSELKTILYRKTTLSNGLRVITEQVPSFESFALGICINSGSRDERSELAGLAHFLEHAAFRHSRTRTSHQIAAQFEAVGAYSNAYTTKEMTCFYVRALKHRFSKTFAILADIVCNPVLRKIDIDKERRIIAEEVKSYLDDPEEVIFDRGDSVLFGSHTLGNPILGDLKTIKKIDSSALSEFHSLNYSPNNIIVAVAGNIPHESAVELAMEFFSNNRTSSNKRIRTSPETLPRTSISESASFQQSHILYGRRIDGLNSPQRHTIAALNVLFGDGMTSRLNKKLRESKSIAYSVYSTLQMYSDCGAFYIYAATDGKKAEKTKALIIEEIKKLANGKISKAEFSRAKEQLKSSIVMDLESMSARMQALARFEFVANKRETLGDTIQKIDSIGHDEISSLAESIFQLNDWSEIIFHA